ncbi:LysR family transcriptional regulator, partial [Photobacterium halotolerans]
PRHKYLAPKVRAFIDFMAEWMTNHPFQPRQP